MPVAAIQQPRLNSLAHLQNWCRQPLSVTPSPASISPKQTGQSNCLLLGTKSISSACTRARKFSCTCCCSRTFSSSAYCRGCEGVHMQGCANGCTCEKWGCAYMRGEVHLGSSSTLDHYTAQVHCTPKSQL